MPKEKVYDGCEMYDIEVGWAPDRAVQVGIETHDGSPLAEKLFHLDEKEYALVPLFTGLWATLDREQINRLIKMLRKARDDAYGRNE